MEKKDGARQTQVQIPAAGIGREPLCCKLQKTSFKLASEKEFISLRNGEVQEWPWLLAWKERGA